MERKYEEPGGGRYGEGGTPRLKTSRAELRTGRQRSGRAESPDDLQRSGAGGLSDVQSGRQQSTSDRTAGNTARVRSAADDVDQGRKAAAANNQVSRPVQRQYGGTTGMRTSRNSRSTEEVLTEHTGRNGVRLRTPEGPYRGQRSSDDHTDSAFDRTAVSRPDRSAELAEAEERARQLRQRREKERREQQMRRRFAITLCACIAAAVLGLSVVIWRVRRTQAEQAAAEAALTESTVSEETGTGNSLDNQTEPDDAAAGEGNGLNAGLETDDGEGRRDIAADVQYGVSMSDEEAERLAENMRREEYPESLISLFLVNAEARQFVLDYARNKDAHPQVDLSEEVVPGQIPHFLQWDERWGYEFYGEDFLALTGCGPTCLSMVYSGLSGKTDKDPYTVALMADQLGYYVEGSGSSWEIMTRFAEKLGLESEEVSFGADNIVYELQQGHPIICAVGPGDFTDRGHFIVLTGVNEDGTLEIRDPNSYERTQQTWDLYDIMDQTRDLWSFSYDDSAKIE